MNTKVRAAVSAVLGIAGTGLSWVSYAQQATQPSGGDAIGLQTIIVTAQKREESLKDVPMSLSALSGSDLTDLQATSFADYAALVPGLALTTAQAGQTRLTLRGQNTGGVGSTVAVYIDESPFGSSTALLNGAVNAGDFDTWDMKRIEVLRGPQGTLYGANSEGGLLKFVTNAPQLGKFAVEGEAGGESVNYGGNGWNARALVNVPLGDAMAFRVSGFYDDLPGYIDDPFRGAQDLNGGRKYGGRASFLFAATSDLSIRLTAEAQKSKYDGTNLVDVDPVTLQPLYGALRQKRAVAEPSEFKYQNYNATIDWSVGRFKLLSATSYGVQDAGTLTDGTPIYGGLAGFFGGDASPLLGNSKLKKFTQEIRLSSPSSDRLEWQVGGYYTKEDGSLVQNLNAVTAATGQFLALMIQPLVDSTYKETSGFVDLTYHVTSQFDIQAGGRYSHNSQDATQSTLYDPALAAAFGITPNPVVVLGKSSENVWTYSVAPSWHFDANTMAYARLATGYRPGGPNVLPPNPPAGVPTQYRSDSTTNVEIGVRSTQLDGRFSLDLALFHVDWKDIQLLEVVQGFGINANGGRARSQGLEWTFGYVPMQGLTFHWTGAFTDAKLSDAAPLLNAADGDRLPYVPKWSTALDGEYKRTLSGNYSGFLGATYSYVGSRRTDFASSTTTPSGQLRLPSYNTYDARIGVENGRYRVTLYGKNLSDSRGITNYTASGAPYTTITVTQPLTVGLSLSAKF